MPLPRCCPPASANDNYCLGLTPHQVLTGGALGEGGRGGGGEGQPGNCSSQGVVIEHQPECCHRVALMMSKICCAVGRAAGDSLRHVSTKSAIACGHSSGTCTNIISWSAFSTYAIESNWYHLYLYCHDRTSYREVVLRTPCT